MTIPKRFRRLISFVLSFTLLFQQFAPVIAYADEVATSSATLSLIVATPTPSITPESILNPTLPPEIEVIPTPSVAVTPPLAETQTPRSTPVLSPDSQSGTPSLWTPIDENTVTTSQTVGEGIDYQFKDSKVSVRFTKIQTAGKLTIREVKLTPEQIVQTGALSDTAYDITSDMENGTFTYDLTLPLPENNQNAKVEFASDQNSLGQATTIDTNVTKNPNTIVIKDLDHFTIFFVTGGSDRATDGSLCTSLSNQCSYNVSEKTSLKYDDDDRFVISEYATNPDTAGFWPDTDYASDRYVQFNFTPGLIVGTVIDNAYLKIVYQTNAIDSSQPFAAKLQLNNPWADFSVDIGPNLTTTNQSYLIPLPASYLTRTKLNGLNTRFFLYGTPQDSVAGVTTDFDQVNLLVNYYAPTSTFDALDNPTNDDTPTLSGTATAIGGTTVINIEYRVDGGSWTTVSPSDGTFDSSSESFIFTTDTLNEGNHLVEIRATDSMDTLQTDSVSANLGIDLTKPTANLVFPTPGPSSTSFTAIFSEDVDPIEATDSANYFLDNWPGAGGSGDLLGDADVSYDEPTKTATITFTSIGWYLSAEQNWGVKNIHDLAGNQMDDTWEYTTPLVSPDSPGVPITSPDPTNSISQLWNWTAATDPGGVEASGIKGYWFNTSVNPTWSYLGNLLSTSTDFSSEGLFQFSVKVEDNAGNLGSESTGEVALDLSAPVMTEKTIFSGWYNSDQTSTFTYTDNIGVSTGTPVECTISTEGEDQTCTNSSVNVCDEAGNCNTTSQISNGANIDKTYPSIVFSDDVDSGPTTSDEINLVITETNPDLTSFKYGFGDDATCDASDSYPNSFVGGETFSISDETNNGKYICAKATDLAGNTTYQISSNPLNIDITNPVGNISNPANNSYQKTRPTYKVTASDASGISSVKFQYRISGSPDFTDLNTDTVSPFQASWGSVVLATNSIYELRAIVTDNPGNFAFSPIISFTFDNLLPDIFYNNPLGGQTVWYNASPTFDIDFLYDDGGAPLDYAQYRIDSGSFKNIFTADRTSDYTNNWGITSWSTLTEGSHRLDIRVTDKAANTNTDNYLASVSGLQVGKDLTSPIVSVPLDQTLEASGPDGTAYVFSPTPSASDANSTPDTTCDYSSGTTFPIGTTTVICSATDLAGNIGSASFDITVQDTTGPSLSLPSDITVEATGSDGATVTYASSANDLVDGSVEVVCSSESGSVFELSTTTVSCSSSDSRDNTSSGSFTVTVQDTTAPNPAGTPSSDSPTNSSLPTWTWIAGSDLVGVDYYKLFWDTSAGGETYSSDNISAATTSFTHSTGLSDGTWYAKIKTFDSAGNSSESDNGSLLIDTVKPSSVISSPNNNGTNSVIYSNSWSGLISGTASDSLSGLDQVDLSVKRNSDGKYWNGDTWVTMDGTEPWVNATGTEAWSYSLTSPAEDSYEIISHAIDLAGNIENSYKLTIVLDKTIPEVTISLDPSTPDSGNNWYKTDPTITLTATDNILNDHLEYQWDSTISTWTVYSSSFKTPGEGNHTLYYRAFDKAGNISQTGIKGIKYDKTDLTNGPLNVSVSPSPTSGNTAKVKWDAALDNVGIEKYEVNWSLDGTSTSYTESVGNEIRELEIKKLDFEGKWNIKVTAFDYAGNNKSGSTELTVDKTATTIPTLTLSGTGVGTATLTWNLVSDASDYILWYGNEKGQYLYGARTGNSNNFTVSGLGSGDYYFVIQSVDGAGNRSGYSNEVNTLSLVGAPGVEPGTPAEGFTPEVLGDTTSETEVAISPTPTPTSSVLGSSSDKNFPWWLLILLISSGFLGVYLLFHRRGNIVN